MPPQDWKDDRDQFRLPKPRTTLQMPVMGMESEFNVWIDEVEIDPKVYFRHPSTFIDRELLPREKSSLQIPTGGAVYFDRGVIEVVTPVIELAPHSTARVVRSLWEGIGFVRDQLTRWEKRSDHTVRLKAYSSHYNISYEIPKRLQTRTRNEKALALLLAYILPIPVMLAGANRRSTGIGVRPRGGRIEVTADFTPDPGLMVAAATLIAGIVREVMTWPSYDLSMLQKMPVPVIADVVPGKHTTRRGWLTKDFHYPQSPFTCDVNAPVWMTQFGERKSLRAIAFETAWYFRRSIRRYSDPFSFRLLFAVMTGRAPSLLELVDRPSAYEDVGHLCHWGAVIHELKNYDAEMNLFRSGKAAWNRDTIDEFVSAREREREHHLAEMANVRPFERRERDIRQLMTDKAKKMSLLDETADPEPVEIGAAARKPKASLSRRTRDTPGKLVPPRAGNYVDRRGMSLVNGKPPRERRKRGERRKNAYAVPFPDRRLTRSAYEQVFLKLVSGSRLRMGKETYTPVGMKGWYHAIFRRDSDGAEKLLTIDQLLKKMNDWT